MVFAPSPAYPIVFRTKLLRGKTINASFEGFKGKVTFFVSEWLR